MQMCIGTVAIVAPDHGCAHFKYVAVCCSVLQYVDIHMHTHTQYVQALVRFQVCCSVLQCVAVCCSVLQCDDIHMRTHAQYVQALVLYLREDTGAQVEYAFSFQLTNPPRLSQSPNIQMQVCCVLQCVAVCVAVCCSMLQCVAVRCRE